MVWWMTVTTLGAVRELQPWGPLPGRRFEPLEERELDGALRYLASTLPGADSSMLITPEFPGPLGVPDLLATVDAERDLAERLADGTSPILREADVAVLAAVAVGRTTTSARVARVAGISQDQAEKRMRSLTSRGALIAVGSGYRRNPAVRSIGRTHALEAKVSNWRRGLAQTLRYASWTDSSSLVLLRRPREIDAAAGIARQLGIGLAVSERWVVRPVLHTPIRSLRLLASERIVATALHQMPSASA